MKTAGVVIGRFQLPELHDGHKALINHVISQNDVTCVLVGVSLMPTPKNPLPYPAVAQMIRGTYAKEYTTAKLFVFPIYDTQGDETWSITVDCFLKLLFPQHTLRLYAGRDSFKSSYNGELPVTDWYGYNGNINGTGTRDRIINGDPIDNPAFRAGIIYGLGNYLRWKSNVSAQLSATNGQL
jgi:bifunctional NMN adenylyltransferase/nudix hydrolase